MGCLRDVDFYITEAVNAARDVIALNDRSDTCGVPVIMMSPADP
jgi:hypothetical protein